MLRDKKCSVFAWQKKGNFQVELPACGSDVSVLHTADSTSLRDKNSLFFCNMAICQVRSAWVRQATEHQNLWFPQKNQHTAVFLTRVVTPSILLAPDAEISLHQGKKQETPDFSGWLTDPRAHQQHYQKLTTGKYPPSLSYHHQLSW